MAVYSFCGHKPQNACCRKQKPPLIKRKRRFSPFADWVIVIRDIVKYPDSSIRRISGNVRFFDDTLKTLIVDLIDTMEDKDINALSAILIGVDLNVIVLKDENGFKTYVNSRIIKHSNVVTKTEKSIYYDGISVDIDRFENITVVYEDEYANQHSVEMEGEKARSFQQQLDHCFGSTFVDRADKEIKKKIDEYLEFGLVKDSRGAESCPIVLYREYFKKAAKYIMMFIFATLFAPIFANGNLTAKIYTVDKYLLVLVPILILCYFFYAKYEASKFKQCTSCQIGNIIGSIFILLIEYIIVLSGVFIWLMG